MKVAVYARVSTKDKGQDTENQLAQLREFATKQGWTIYREYVDHESGAKTDRPEFRQMFEDASRRKFDLLLFWALDRLSREGALKTVQHLQLAYACLHGCVARHPSLRGDFQYVCNCCTGERQADNSALERVTRVTDINDLLEYKESARRQGCEKR